MKLTLLLIASLWFESLIAANPTLPENSFAVDLLAGTFVESAVEEGVHRLWNGKAWEWRGSPLKGIHHFEKGLLVQVSSKERAPITYAYENGRMIRRTIGDSHYVEFIYDELGRVVEERAPLGKDASSEVLARFVYGSGFTEVINALGNKKIYYWNDDKAIVAIEHYLEGAIYRTERFVWNQGELVSQTLENGLNEVLATSDKKTFGAPQENGAIYQYGSKGQLLSKTMPSGRSESYQWDSFGNLVGKVSSSDGNLETFTYDFMNRLIRDSDGFSYEYDKLGQRVKMSDPQGNETDFVYDELGRMVAMIQPEVLDPESRKVRPVTRWKYNELDQAIERVDPDGTAIPLSQEDFSEPVVLPEIAPVEIPTEAPKLDLPCKPNEVWVINDRGQRVLQTSFTNLFGIKNVQTYDALRRVEKLEKYDLLGNLFFTQEFRYTLSGIKAVEITDDFVVEWVWGPSGRLDALIEGKGSAEVKTTRFSYDAQGRLSDVFKPSGLCLHYTYDESGALETLVSSDQGIDYAFVWEQGRLKEVRDRKVGTSTLREYDEKGRLIRETLANGLTLSWDEERLILPDQSRIRYVKEGDRLKKIVRENEEGIPLYTHAYTSHDALGQLVEEHLIHGLGTVTYQRDEEQRVVRITSPHREEAYRYEGWALKDIDVDGETTSFEYDAAFRLKGDVSDRSEFDLDGNKIYAFGHHLVYDALGRLIEVDGTWFYEYDAFNRRISKRGPEGTTLFLWDGSEEIGSTGSDRRIKELKVMGPQGPVAIEIDRIAYAPLKDAKGSVKDLAGLKTAPSLSPWGYLGKREDPETGFIYFGDRFLDPAKREFLTPDPKGYSDGPDRYQFAKSNPNAYSDAWGHFALLDFCKSLLQQGYQAYSRFQETLTKWHDWAYNLMGLETVKEQFEDFVTKALGKGYLIQAGWHKQEGQTGVFGNGEINPHVRVTFNHGILTIRSDLFENVRQISTSHGGVNVHYIFRPTSGFADDIIKCGRIKLGYLSPESKELVKLWKLLIKEMGGVNGGGRIVHYAHSIGGTDTFNALTHLTVEEQRMMDIRTFGSATLIPDVGTYTAANYVSKRDPICAFDLIRYITGIITPTNIYFVGTIFGGPWDHQFSEPSYQGMLSALGQAFIATYGG